MRTYKRILPKLFKIAEKERNFATSLRFGRMVRNLLFSAILVSNSWLCQAQCPAFGDISLTRQAEVTNFNTIFPGCTQVLGGLNIGIGSGSDPITDLSALSVLTKVSGGLGITSLHGITSLNGLHNITSIEGDFNLADLPEITSLAGLTKLVSVTGDFQLFANFNLETLDGLNAITSISGSLELEVNPNLTDISKLSAITSTQGLGVFGCSSLTSLTGLQGITSISEYLSIINNENLAGLAGLSSLTSLAGNLNISSNSKITDLAALHALTDISGDVYISENTAMTTLNGLENLTSVGGSFELSQNNALTSLSKLSNLATVGRDFGIYNHPVLPNLSGVGSLTSVERLGISGNGLLTNLSGFTNLTTISKAFWITQNPVLTSLQGLGKVTSTLEEIDISENPLLTNISALAKISGVTDYLSIGSNTSLANCVVAPVCALIASSPAKVGIGNNTGNCSTIELVRMACEAALPVELVLFRVAKEGNEAALQWETTSEINSSRFEIERSNGLAKNWMRLATMLTKGESRARLNYTFTDQNPLNGINLYRLKMVDLDRSFSYSRIVAVTFENDLGELFPNPASDKVYVKESLVILPVQVFDADGKMILSGSVSEQKPVDVSRLANGLYIFNIGDKKKKIIVHH